MDEQRKDEQQDAIYKSVQINDVAFKTYRNPLTIEKGGGRGSGRSILAVRHDDYDV